MKTCLLVALLWFTQVQAQDHSCLMQYQQEILELEEKLELDYQRLPLQVGTAGIGMAVLALVGQAYIAIPLGVGIGVLASLGWGSREIGLSRRKRALALQDQESRPFKRLFRRAKRKLPNLTKDDLSDYIAKGFVSGSFCPSRGATLGCLSDSLGRN